MKRLDANKIYRIGALVAAALLLYRFGIRTFMSSFEGPAFDGLVDWKIANGFWTGVSPYPSAPALYTDPSLVIGHPPTSGFWFLPLALVDLDYLKHVWNPIILVMWLLQLWLIARELRAPAPFATAVLLFAATLSTSWMAYHLRIAQISIFIALLYTIAWLLLRRGRDATAGIVLGCACTLKLFPGVLILALLLSGRVRSVLTASLVYISIGVIMTARLGLVAWRDFMAAEPQIVDRWIAHSHNESLPGFVHRLFVPSCVARSPSLWMANAIAAVISVALFCVFAWISRKVARSRDLIDLPFALFASLSVFANPFMFEHYYALLVLPWCIALAYLVRAHRAGMTRGLSLALDSILVVTVVLVAIGIYAKGSGDVEEIQQLRGWRHLRFHLLEIAGCAPTALLLSACAALLVWTPRERSASLPC